MPFRTTQDAEVKPRSESQFTPSVHYEMDSSLVSNIVIAFNHFCESLGEFTYTLKLMASFVLGSARGNLV